ncbi:MAG: TonB-dependent receptor plug domain-containing protein [Chloroflexia bacterium]|nr:TonB-dependent receptor plug domain-containing protein [Chloroflexia bacterium]
MKPQEIEIGQQTIINVTLYADDQNLDEVIVVAYGTTRKEATTGSVSVVKSEEIAEIPISSAEKALQGRVAGLQLNSMGGQLNGYTQIRIRGTSSINSGNEPLIVVDGVPITSGDWASQTSSNNILSSIDPKDIESMTVLKDAAAASVYGSRAANGVVLITTKSGKKGKTTF